MAKILYSVCGVGRGHASRSSVIIKELLKKHEILVVSYSDGYEFLKGEFDTVERLEWFNYIYKKNRINRPLTLFLAFWRFPNVFFRNYKKLNRLFKKFNPDVVISDFDINALLAAYRLKKPSILISNMHMIEYIKPRLNFLESIEFNLTDRLMVATYNDKADYYIITSIAKPDGQSKNPKIFFFGPIVRDKASRMKPRKKNFFLVYMSQNCLRECLPLFKKINEKFVIYGYKPGFDGNLEFREFSSEDWLKSIRDCRALFSHGGLNSISEAIALKKPVYVFAAKDWFERYHNGFLVERNGFGMLQEKPSVDGINFFISRLEYYESNFKNSSIASENGKILKKIEALVDSLVKL